ncbi:MAG: ABC transporter permease, partial [Proteobacteria bacterium]|nr:ABC transporter permease [Pseudomonadota bacterium]
MTTYILRRLLLILPTFLGITVMVFVITRFVPGGPIERMIAQAQQMQSMDGKSGARTSSREQNQPLSQEQIEELK